MKNFLFIYFAAVVLCVGPSAIAAQNPGKGFRCFLDSRRWDGVLKEYALRLNLKEKYDVTYLVSKDDKSKPVIIAKNLNCVTAKEDFRVTKCSKSSEEETEAMNSGFSSTVSSTIGVRDDGTSYSYETINFEVYSPLIPPLVGTLIPEDQLTPAGIYKSSLNLADGAARCEKLK